MASIKLTIDGKEIAAETGETIIQAAEKVGINIPHYCYHPGLSIDGNCRMCLVEVEKAPKPMIACSTRVAEGMVVKTQTEKVVKMRRSVMEFLLINHPLDCPTCDQAGECRLQDYYMQYDEIPSRFKEEKIHKNKMINLGANVMLDQERCVACTRCIRTCQEVAGVDELALANRGDHVTITTFPGKELSNPYAGNVVDVCPVGALTNKKFRFKKRVWFLKSTPSVCTGCSRGCNVWIDHADSVVYRLRPRFNPDVNKYWMCDEGRYGFEFINQKRILRPLLVTEGESQEISYEQALTEVIDLLKGVNTAQIAVVAHAGQTAENLKSFHEFAVKVLKTDKLYYSKNEVDHPTQDSILITPDKNANQAEINRLGFKPVTELAEAKGILVLNNLSRKDLAHLMGKKIPLLALWASNESDVVSKTRVVLPVPTFAEQGGNFTNVDGRVQEITKAFEPKGESRLLRDSLVVLQHMLASN
ncbi:MAG: hypothetical protein A2048_08495 [Deltaproteobacteria bacterium GWA2_45_12]|nr:MAG: hypothetical protein A2048_08495 [Deltaproteobacteria bacterium GWA2_45_12]